jgi:hypothetical protein
MAHERLVTQTSYEWDLEITDEHDDVVDHIFHDKCPGLIARNRQAVLSLKRNESVNLVLVRNVGEGYKSDPLSFGLIERSWAYVKDGKLPETFDDGYSVPKRFHKELEKAS